MPRRDPRMSKHVISNVPLTLGSPAVTYCGVPLTVHDVPLAVTKGDITCQDGCYLDGARWAEHKQRREELPTLLSETRARHRQEKQQAREVAPPRIGGPNLEYPHS